MASEAEQSTGTCPESPTLLCMAWDVSPSDTALSHSHLRDTLRIGIPSANSTHSAVPKDPDETLFDSSFLQQTCDI